jgi:hypothetical protein
MTVRLVVSTPQTPTYRFAGYCSAAIVRDRH